MHPIIRAIIHTSNYYQAVLKEAGSLLPEDDAELDGWIGKAVAEYDSGGFTVPRQMRSWDPCLPSIPRRSL